MSEKPCFHFFAIFPLVFPKQNHHNNKTGGFYTATLFFSLSLFLRDLTTHTHQTDAFSTSGYAVQDGWGKTRRNCARERERREEREREERREREREERRE